MMPSKNNDKTANQKFHLLVVDDNEMNRDLISLQLRKQGYQISVAASGYQALELLETQKFDLILLDIMMPGMNGLDMLLEVRKKHSLLSLPIIMVTADDLEESIIEALKRGANDYLVKPLNLPVAIARVKTQLTLKELDDLKGEFVQFASHDLKKPLLVAMDIAESLKNDCVPDKPVKQDTPEVLELLFKTCENMQNVIDGFLNTESFGTGVADSKRPAPLNTVVSKSIQNNTEYAKKKGITLKEELANDLPEIELDEFRITQVLDNLIGNAMKFSPKDTTTTVRTRTDGHFVYAEISDGGPGLTEEDMKKLFQRHARLSNRPTGGETSTGVGLSLSKQLIEQHNGVIGARNNPTHGATFWIRLPVKPPQPN
ncbi:hybrid sensor histidine kinase/response regulator [Kaarinaea lacus]